VTRLERFPDSTQAVELLASPRECHSVESSGIKQRRNPEGSIEQGQEQQTDDTVLVHGSARTVQGRMPEQSRKQKREGDHKHRNDMGIIN
jgi:hypothetical protein